MKTFCGTILAAALAANATAAGSPYGVCAHITRDEPSARTCAMMRQAGMGWVRTDFDWHSIERKLWGDTPLMAAILIGKLYDLAKYRK